MAETMPNFWLDENYVPDTEGEKPNPEQLASEWTNKWQEYGQLPESEKPALGKDGKYERLLPLGANGKQQKAVYLAKMKPVVEPKYDAEETEKITQIFITPGSKTVKLKVSGLQKVPNVKVDYKKQSVTLKKDMQYNYGNISQTALENNEIEFAENGDDIPYFVKTVTEGEPGGSEPIADDRKTTDKTVIPFFNGKDGILDIYDAEKFKGTNVSGEPVEQEYIGMEVYTAATEKKPRSEKIRILVHNSRKFTSDDADIISAGFDENKHAFKLPEGYEVLVDGKWKTSLKISGNMNGVKVRVKSTGKFTKEFPYMEGTVGSSEAVLDVGYGNYVIDQDENGANIMSEKPGVTRIKITYTDYTKEPTDGKYPEMSVEIPEPEPTPPAAP
jgi:hypothetical protein